MYDMVEFCKIGGFLNKILLLIVKIQFFISIN